MTLALDLQSLSVGDRPMLRGVTLRVAPGEILTVMGPSGCGKSSLLAVVAGTLAPPLRWTGTLTLDGTDLASLPTARRGVGLLLQDPLLFAHLSVAENLLFAVPPGPRAERHAAVDAALAEAGLAGCGERDPATLSGGQRARVALMRALLARPRALLLDEPFAALDAALRAQFRAFVFDHVRERGIPALLVTHDAADIADPVRVLRLPSAPDAPAHA